MKFITAIKRLEKIGKIKNSGVFYWVEKQNKRLTFIDNGGTKEEATCFHIDYLDKNKEKYHTSYYDNLTQMLKYS